MNRKNNVTKEKLMIRSSNNPPPTHTFFFEVRTGWGNLSDGKNFRHQINTVSTKTAQKKPKNQK